MTDTEMSKDVRLEILMTKRAYEGLTEAERLELQQLEGAVPEVLQPVVEAQDQAEKTKPILTCSTPEEAAQAFQGGSYVVKTDKGYFASSMREFYDLTLED